MSEGKDDREKLNQASEWLSDPEASPHQKVAAFEHVLDVVHHSENASLRTRTMAIVQGTGMLP
jgi:hypothetical protein